ncbi:uncharacterized protein LOC133191491 [Saccostrea echinata]|uniref:uncharacterized protein LOC133191491 n=1 Tax=Saccostrea echinata TaxID=191078 RepID=UPI002A80FCD4|nr:uncharacterized protein LOC133191491 [Saccostrea echinata]
MFSESKKLPKKTGGHSKKYMGLFFLMVGCVIISVCIASVLSTKYLLQNLPSAVEEKLRNGAFLKLKFVNVSSGELKNHIESLRSDFNVWKEDNKENFYRLIQARRCLTNCSDHTDGDYQSCFTCEGYISCVNGVLLIRKCVPSYANHSLYWDDFKKLCRFTSRTCNPSYTLSAEENN